MSSSKVIKNSVYLVTGGGSGLGKATVKMLLEAGGKVAICDIKLPEKSDPIYQYDDNLILPFKSDVTSEEDIQNLYVEIKKKFGKLNGIINCAGIGYDSPIYDFEKQQPHSLVDFRKVLDVHIVGTFNVIRLGIPLLVESVQINPNKEQSIIINTSSILGHTGMANGAAYCCCKGGIIALTQPLAKELKDYGIRVVDIAPGGFDTPIIEKYFEDYKSYFGFPKRYGQPEEYAQFVKAIIEIAFINGRSMRIDALNML